MVLYTEGDTPALEREAEWIMFQVLAPAYPNHPWAVRAYPGGFFIRHLDFPANWGMNCPKPSEAYSASAYKRKVIMMAGEWLERANLRRGPGDGEQEIKHIEGVPDRWQTNTPLNAIVGVDGQPLRTEPHQGA